MGGQESGDELVLFTNNYPYGAGETFLEAEIPFLSRRFARVHVISANTNSAQTRDTPGNVSSARLSLRFSASQKVWSLRFLADPLLREEVRWIRSVDGRNPSGHMLKVMLASFRKAGRVKECAERLASLTQTARLHFYSYWANDCALGISLIETPKTARRVCRAHGGDVYHERHRDEYLPFRHQLFSRLDTVAFISEHARAYTTRKMKRDYASFSVAKIGIAPAGNQAPRPDYRSHELIVVSCSWMKPIKRLDLIVRALSLMPDRVQLKWLHVGTGPMESATRALAAELLSNKANIAFEFVGHIPNSEIPLFFARSHPHVLLNVSESEGVPVSIMEAYRSGIPAIATDVGGVSELVDGSSGFLLSGDCSPADIADALLRFVELSEVEKLRMSTAAIEVWRRHYNADRNYPEFIAAHFG